MGIASIPAATASGGSQDGFSFTATTAQKTYEVNQSFSSGVYTISTSPTSNQAEVFFTDGTQVSSAATTVSGTVTYALSFNATSAYIKPTGDSTQVTIDQVATSLAGADIALSGTVDTITATGTYNQTGLVFAVAISGGTGGGGGATIGFPNTNDRNGGGVGGHGGNVATYLGYVNAATPVTVGAGGNGGANTQTGGSGGATNFGNLAQAAAATHNANQQTSPDGNFGAGASGGYHNANAGASTNNYKSVVTGTYGGGGRGGSGSQGSQNGAGSGIGTGGAGAANGTNDTGAAATGYASGGGGGKNNSVNAGTTGGAGSPGVIYVIRGF